jgi:3-phosphoshikimate 1-carboxyvinyltransferase
MQRACAAALIRKGETVLHNAGNSNDDKAALDIIANLGAEISFEQQYVIIKSNGVQPITNELNAVESGLSVRMFTFIAALSNQSIQINGVGTLLKRPMHFFEEILPQLSVKIESNNGSLPFKIKGPLQPENIVMDATMSSQYLTGLLMAYSAAEISSPKTIQVTNLNSKPYIDLTLEVMKAFKLNVPINHNYQKFEFQPKQKENNETIHYDVEGDWSNAAFLLVAGALFRSLTVIGLNINSMQADKKIIDVLQLCGTSLNIINNQIEISSSSLQSFQFDATDCPDLFPPLVALASYCEGTSMIKGVNRLRHKESNRGLTLQEEFGKMGIEIVLEGDLMKIKGGKPSGAVIDSHFDHRIAMACSIAALGASSITIIEKAEAVNKSYPAFYDHLKKLGVNIQS